MNAQIYKRILTHFGWRVEKREDGKWWVHEGSYEGCLSDLADNATEDEAWAYLLTNSKFNSYILDNGEESQHVDWYKNLQALEDEIARLQAAKQFLDELRKEME